MLQGLMQDQPLLISNLIAYAELHLGIERQSLYGSSCTIFSSRSANSFRRHP
jgi:hypothetical protein